MLSDRTALVFCDSHVTENGWFTLQAAFAAAPAWSSVEADCPAEELVDFPVKPLQGFAVGSAPVPQFFRAFSVSQVPQRCGYRGS